MYATMNSTFTEWLSSEMELRGWSQAELARRANTSRSAINGLLSGSRGPGPDLARSIAHALKLPDETVFRAAGLLPPVSELDELKAQMLELTANLSREEQREILEYLRMKRRLREEREQEARPIPLRARAARQGR